MNDEQQRLSSLIHHSAFRVQRSENGDRRDEKITEPRSSEEVQAGT
jgi:hypothetical protein